MLSATMPAGMGSGSQSPRLPPLSATTKISSPKTTANIGDTLASTQPMSPLRSKRTFKEKLFAELSKAEMEAAAQSASNLKDKQQLSIEMLVDGHPQAFIDFFYLTHHDGSAEASQGAGDGVIRPESHTLADEIPTQRLQFLRDNLVLIETADRKGDMATVYDAFHALALYFQSAENHSKCIFFHKRCLAIATRSNDYERMMQANLNLGTAHERIGDTAAAISYHEAHLAIAAQLDSASDASGAHRNLLHSYRQSAEEHEAAGDYEQAVLFLEKCRNLAQVGNDREAEALADYRLGMAHLRQGSPSTAVMYLAQSMDICCELEDKMGQGNACCALAEAYQQLGEISSAISNLHSFLELSKDANALAQARACCSLGVIYQEQARYEDACRYLEKFYEIAHSMADGKLRDIARINLGVARGQAAMQKYLKAIKGDLPTLLAWKNARKPLEDK